MPLVKVKSNTSGRTTFATYSHRQLLEFDGEEDLIEHATECNCEPLGDLPFTECNCCEDWMDCEVYIGDEIK